ncbi:hypothetical protein TSUD_315610 [Trifolium subterraneum]|uniref:CBM-cenC domain-containing protein n=1 Tax=Trifolium subterraneum TaxID=3900 RepID=A0A2Z6MI04_TRISU|nr:hypothetical protein TSUD_315610 [Trifolium subterraneum]
MANSEKVDAGNLSDSEACTSIIHYYSKTTNTVCVSTDDENIILNPQFEDGLNNWTGRGCKITLHDSIADGKILPKSGKFFASATERTQSWNGIQQEITGRVQRKLVYEVTALVRIFGNNVTPSDVRATLYVQKPDFREQYIGISKQQIKIGLKFREKGPPAGTDILLNTLVIKHAAKTPPSSPPDFENVAFGVNIIENSNLDNGINGWSPLGNCTLSVGTGSPRVLPPMARDSLGPHESLSGRYILITNRTQTYMGPSQTITEKLTLYLTYQVSAWVRISSGSHGPQNVGIALSVDGQWVNGGQTEVADSRWHEIGGSFRIEKQSSNVFVYIQGPVSGVDLMVAGLQIFPVDRQARFRYLRKQTDKIRKRDVTLKFSGLDTSEYTFVKVRQLQNDFPIGSCINRTNIDNEDFVDFFVQHFNWAVFGNELKWYWTEPQRGNLNYKDADDILGKDIRPNMFKTAHQLDPSATLFKSGYLILMVMLMSKENSALEDSVSDSSLVISIDL